MSYFPRIIIPESILEIKHKLPKIPNKPVKPKKPTTHLKGFSIWLIIGSFLFLNVLLNSGDLSATLVGFIGTILLIILLFSNKKKRDKKKDIYLNELNTLPVKEEEYNRKIHKILHPESIRSYRIE